MLRPSIAFLLASAAATSALADLQGIRLGTDAPPDQIGGNPMVPFAFDSRIFEDVVSVPDPLGGAITFNSAMSVRQIGLGWATWSHGYTGNVYYCNGRTDVTTTLVPGTKAVYFYVEPGPFGVFDITSTVSDGSSTVSFTDGIEGFAGAQGYGFYTTGGADIVSIRITTDQDFSIGEFAVSRIPAPGSAAAFGLASIAALRRRRS